MYWHVYYFFPYLYFKTEPSCGAEGTLRLVGGGTEREGTVEVCQGGAWGTVCDDQWGTPDAAVVCRQLGYPFNGECSTKFALNFSPACNISFVGKKFQSMELTRMKQFSSQTMGRSFTLGS